MRWFFDMCILIYYTSEDNSFLSKKTREFIKKNENEEFLVCYYITDWDLPKWIKRQNILIDEVIKKIKDDSYDLNSSKNWNLLYPREKQKIEKFILKSKSVDKELFIKNLLDSQKYLELRINNFIEKKTRKVVPISEIDFELKSSLFSHLENNESDANIIASGILHHQKEKIVLITADKIHWTKENIEWAIPQGSLISKKYPKIPKIKYIQDI